MALFSLTYTTWKVIGTFGTVKKNYPLEINALSEQYQDKAFWIFPINSRIYG
jgi:hypothetical protein